ncbi:MAG: methionyl-tRNA formyltransferase [Nitrospirota bacterium]|nr:methionyl-tRNA formyltransferase [Nitrospirota bacterium]MDE3225942.1 methionyl-tRNA formyltransferase [Nitrospirota bacterium]MDE3241394.1 methionyl-tRNA formyltransferase [Nitrospirota bacterium]
MRIVFMGTPEFAVASLDALLRSPHDVVGVVTQPDRPKGRGQEVVASPVKLVAQRAQIPILQPLKMKDPGFVAALQAWQPEVIVVAAFGRILPKIILDLPPRGCVNVHASLLPKYRGAGPIQWAVINGERETGITTMQMDEGMDTGAILLQEPVPIAPDDTAGTLSSKLAEVGGRLLLDTLRRLDAGDLAPRPQDHAQATMAPLLKKEDGAIDWTLPAVAIANRVRGLSPWPGAYTYRGPERWSLWKADAVEPAASGTGQPAVPGTLLAAGKDALLVQTGSGVLRITEFQPANSRRMSVAQYLAGHTLESGLRLGPPPSTPAP